MKILFIATRYHNNQHGWVHALQHTGHAVKFISFYKLESNENYSLLEPIVITQHPVSPVVKWLIDTLQKLQGKLPRTQFHYRPDKQQLEKEIVNFGPDLMIIRDATFPLSRHAYKIARQHNITSVLYNQYPLEAPEHRTVKILQWLNMTPKIRVTPRRSSGCVHNEQTNSYYLPLVANIPETISTRTYCPTGTLRILCVAKFDLSRKNHIKLLEALLLLHSINIHVTFVGTIPDTNDAYFKSITAFIEEHQLGHMVTIKTNVPFDQMREEFLNHDVFVLPSIREPYAISPIEAMHYGLPVILTTDNGTANVIKIGRNGYLVQPNDAADLARKIRLMTHPEHCQTLGHNAYTLVNESFSQAVFLQHFNTIVNRLGL